MENKKGLFHYLIVIAVLFGAIYNLFLMPQSNNKKVYAEEERSRVIEYVCEDCDPGDHKIICPSYCDNGKVVCDNHCNNGSCPDCNGEGHTNTPCNQCDDFGEIDGEQCNYCRGSKFIFQDCSTCSGKGECTKCDGKGQLDCEMCHGQGRIECLNCFGTGTATDNNGLLLTLDANGVTINETLTQPNAVRYGDVFNQFQTLSSDEYKFIGWNTDKNASSASVSNDSGYQVTSDKTFYALWEEKASVSIDETAQELTYNLSAQSFELKGTSKNLSSITVEYKVNNVWTTVAPTTAGSYSVKITRATDDVYKAYSKEIANGLIINKANPVITLSSEEAIVVTEGETIVLPTATSDFGTVVVDKQASDLVNAGSYIVTYTIVGTDNYNTATKTIQVTVNAVAKDEKGISAFGIILIILASLIFVYAALFAVWKIEYINSIKNDNDERKLKFLDIIFKFVDNLIFKNKE